MWQVVWGIVGGVVSGAVTALLGYAKSSTVESFDVEKAVQTLIVGAIVGGCAGYWGVSYTQAYEYLVSVGAITLIEAVKKAVWRRIKR
jgi:uncharacterized membrane protein YeaQ/YmgE (transglycosylase-associated protein family)